MKRAAVMVAATAALVLTACGGDAAEPEASEAPTSESAMAADVVLEATDALQFKQTALAVVAGEVTIELVCGAAVPHNLVLEGVDDDAPVAECDGGTAGAGTVTLEAGTYTYYCSIPGHRATMEGTLTVS